MAFIRFFTYSNLLISFGAALQVYWYSQLLGEKESLLVAVFVFWATLFTYSWHRYVKRNEPQVTPRITWGNKHPHWQTFFIIASFFGVGLSLLNFTTSFIALASFLGFLTFIYIGWPQKKSLSARQFGWLKISLIAVCWATTIIYLPQLVANHAFEYHHLWWAERFLFIFLITLPFDIRDMLMDDEQVKTIPKIVGIKTTKRLGISIAFTLILLQFLPQSETSYSNILLYAIAGYMLLKSDPKKQKDLFYSFGIDGLLILDILLREMEKSLF